MVAGSKSVLLALSLGLGLINAVSVPDPLPKICYSGGVIANPCQGTSCAPCWVEQPDGTWACYDLLSDGTCQWGDNVGDRVKNRNNSKSSKDSSDDSESSDEPTSTKGSKGTKTSSGASKPTGITVSGGTQTKRYSSTSYLTITSTLSDSSSAIKLPLLTLASILPIITVLFFVNP